MQINRVEVGEGANWYARGWRLFMKKPLFWVLLFLAPMVIAALLIVFLPLLGTLVVSLLGPVIGAGLYHAARTADDGAEPGLAMLFEGFSRKEATVPLLTLGVIALVVSFAADLISRRLIGAAVFDVGMAGAAAAPAAGGLFALLLVLLIEIAIAVAFFYAVPLVWFKGVAPVEAIKASFSAGLKNFVPLLLFGLIGGVLTVLAILPMMLGLLLLVPVMFLAMYHSYRSQFPD